MRSIKYIIVIFFLTQIVYPQSTDLEFKHYTTQDGLSGDYIMDIVQDDNGFLWFSTDGGLSKFDGYTFKSFMEMN